VPVEALIERKDAQTTKEIMFPWDPTPSEKHCSASPNSRFATRRIPGSSVQLQLRLVPCLHLRFYPGTFDDRNTEQGSREA